MRWLGVLSVRERCGWRSCGVCCARASLYGNAPRRSLVPLDPSVALNVVTMPPIPTDQLLPRPLNPPPPPLPPPKPLPPPPPNPRPPPPLPPPNPPRPPPAHTPTHTMWGKNVSKQECRSELAMNQANTLTGRTSNDMLVTILHNSPLPPPKPPLPPPKPRPPPLPPKPADHTHQQHIGSSTSTQ